MNDFPHTQDDTDATLEAWERPDFRLISAQDAEGAATSASADITFSLS